MNTIAQGNMGNMVLTNSGMGGMGVGGAGMIKQQIGAGPGGMMNAGPGGVGPVGPGNMGPAVGGPQQGMHMGGPGGHPQVMQNGPMMRMVGQHMLRGQNPHLMGGNGPGGIGGGPRMQNPNMQMGKFIKSLLFSIVNLEATTKKSFHLDKFMFSNSPKMHCLHYLFILYRPNEQHGWWRCWTERTLWRWGRCRQRGQLWRPWRSSRWYKCQC